MPGARAPARPPANRAGTTLTAFRLLPNYLNSYPKSFNTPNQTTHTFTASDLNIPPLLGSLRYLNIVPRFRMVCTAVARPSMRQTLCLAAALIACPSSALHHATVLRRPCARPLPAIHTPTPRRSGVPLCRAPAPPDVDREAPNGVAVGGALASSAIIAEGVQIAGTAVLLYLGQRYTGAETPVEVTKLEVKLAAACVLSRRSSSCPDAPPARSWCRCSSLRSRTWAGWAT